MKKDLVSKSFPAFLLSCLLMGCWDATTTGKVNYGAEVKGKVVVGHSRVLPTPVKDMVTNRSAVLSKIRAADGETEDAVQNLVSFVYDEVLKEIPEEDKADFMESGVIDIPVESGLALSEEDQKMVYRGADGKDYIGDPVLEMYQLSCKLSDMIDAAFYGIEVSKEEISGYLSSEVLSGFPEKVALNKAAESIIVSQGYNKIEELAKKYSCTIDIEKYYEITDRITELNSSDGTEQKYADGRSSFGSDSGSSPAWLVPANVPDAAVFVMQSDSTVALIIRAGIPLRTFSHAGLFSKAAYDKYSRLEPNIDPLGRKSVQSATGDSGTCLQTLDHFGSAKKFAAVLPRNYNANSAAAACADVERIYRCDSGGVAYSMPWWEMFCNGWWGSDTSHDLTSSRPYCSKLPYTGWKLHGVNVDSGDWVSNLIHPQELNDSQYDRYVFSARHQTVVWWTWSWKKGWKKHSKVIQIGWNIWKTYSRTTCQLFRKG